MRQHFKNIIVNTGGITMVDVTKDIHDVVAESNIKAGHCVVSSLHTSASLLIQENASKNVLTDLVQFFDSIAPCSDIYSHREEGPDDMPAHIKTAITQTHLTLSVWNATLQLGTWQGIFLCEFRNIPQSRTVNCHLLGE